MPRKKQDCPKRMKWEEELAAAAAAREAAIAAGLLDPNQIVDEFEPDPDQSQDSESSSSSPARDDVDEEEDKLKEDKPKRKSSPLSRGSMSPGRNSPAPIMGDPTSAAAAAATNLQNLQSLPGRKRSFPRTFISRWSGGRTSGRPPWWPTLGFGHAGTPANPRLRRFARFIWLSSGGCGRHQTFDQRHVSVHFVTVVPATRFHTE